MENIKKNNTFSYSRGIECIYKSSDCYIYIYNNTHIEVSSDIIIGSVARGLKKHPKFKQNIIINRDLFIKLIKNDFKDNHYFYMKESTIMITDEKKTYEGYIYVNFCEKSNHIGKPYRRILNDTEDCTFDYIYVNGILKIQTIMDIVHKK